MSERSRSSNHKSRTSNRSKSNRTSNSRSSNRSKSRTSNRSNRSNSKRISKKYISPNNDAVPINHVRRVNNSSRPYLHPGFKAKVLHEEPYIVKLEKFLNDEEINDLVAIAEHNGFERSNMVVDGELQINDYRTSLTSYLLDDGLQYTYTPAIENVIKRICYLCGCKRNQIEGLMMVKYEASQEAYFWNHIDYFTPDEIDKVDDGAGNRVQTVFVYLNTIDQGGETEFTKIGLKSKPVKGNAVFWWNIDKEGNMIPETEHRGNPVSTQDKLGLNIWIRQKGW